MAKVKMQAPATTGQENYCNTRSAERTRQVNCDEEAWLIDRLATLVRTAAAIKECKRVSADNDIVDQATMGAIHGAAIEICYTLGLEPEMVNIRKLENLRIAYRGVYSGEPTQITPGA